MFFQTNSLYSGWWGGACTIDMPILKIQVANFSRFLTLQISYSCKHEGYADYPFPAAWGSDVNNYAHMEDCPNVPPDGNGVPEQFWNCGEVKIERKRGSKKGPSFDKGWYRDEADNGDVEKPPSPIPEKVNDEESNHMMDSPDSSPTPVMNLPNYGETHANDEAQGVIDEDFGVEISADELEVEVIKEEQEAEVVEDIPAPTGPCANPDFFGYKGTDDCSAYIWCQNGVAGGKCTPVYSCCRVMFVGILTFEFNLSRISLRRGPSIR